MKSLIFCWALLFALALPLVYSQTSAPTPTVAPTGPPGACLEGQEDDQTHPASAYSPVLYSFAPTQYINTTTKPYLIFMSYNIQSNYDLYCAQVLSNQTAFMANVAPDFLGLQETDIDIDIRCQCNIPQTVANALSHTSYFMMMFPWRNGKYGDTTSLGFTVLDLTYLYFNVSNNFFEQRGALAHLVQPPQLGGWKMWYINSHLEETSLDIRLIQVSQLITWVQTVLTVQEPDAVVVMTGDFYTVPGDTSYESMRTYFSNAWETFNGSPDGGYTHPSDVPSERFDHIWFKEPASNNIKVNINSFTVYPSILSDHRPIWSNISFTLNSYPPTQPPTPAPTEAPTAAPTEAPTNPPPSDTSSSSSSPSSSSSSSPSSSSSSSSSSGGSSGGSQSSSSSSSSSGGSSSSQSSPPATGTSANGSEGGATSSASVVSVGLALAYLCVSLFL